LGVIWQQMKLPRIDADVLWGPHGTLPLRWRKPSVITVHDLTSITMPGRHRLKTILSFNLFIGQSLEKATRVACVSHAIADEVIRGFAVPPSKIAIVPNGVDEFFSPGGDEDDYILYAGTLEPRKGIDLLIEAWRALPSPRPRLVLAGDAGWKSSHLRAGENIEITGYVTRERLRELYRRAKVFVYPSLYEGFGIPPLEAMACGAAVIATRTGAIEEFAGHAAIVIEPNDRQALHSALSRLLGDNDLRQELKLRAPDRARHFGWDRSAAEMSTLFEEAVRC